MGDFRPHNGGGSPPDDGGGANPGDLPDFPPEWGTVVIPDDAAELDEEAEALRRELYRDSRRGRLRSALGISALGLKAEPIKAQPGTDVEPSSLGIPVVIMAVAILTTLVSLFIVTWGRQPGPPLPVTSPPSAARDSGRGVATAGVTTLADLVLTDATGAGVRLGALLPAVILLADGCDCGRLVLDVGASAPAGVTVLAVGRTMPAITPPGSAGAPANVRGLADPGGVLRSRYAPGTAGAPGVAMAVLVNGAGDVVKTVAKVDSVDDVTPIDGL